MEVSGKTGIAGTVPGLREPVIVDAAALLAGSQRHFAVVETDWGVCGVAWRVAGVGTGEAFAAVPPNAVLSRVITPGQDLAVLRGVLTVACGAGCVEVLPGGNGVFHPETVPTWFGELAELLRGTFANAEPGYTVAVDRLWRVWQHRLDWSAVTPFQRKVLTVVGQIPCGGALTYGEVAARVGVPGGARAVGMALGRNPWPVLVPCHRVVGSKGAMTGFSAPGGVETKRRMLEREGWGKVGGGL